MTPGKRLSRDPDEAAAGRSLRRVRWHPPIGALALLGVPIAGKDVSDRSQELAMKKWEALDLAIESMSFRTIGLEPFVKDWLRYGEKLAFRKDESRRAADLFERLNEAIAILRDERDAARRQ